jgi:hypothetical protein
MQASSHDYDMRVPRVTLHVNRLKFRTSDPVVTQMIESHSLTHSLTGESAGDHATSTTTATAVSERVSERVLREVSFTAPPGQLTYILSDSREERR